MYGIFSSTNIFLEKMYEIQVEHMLIFYNTEKNGYVGIISRYSIMGLAFYIFSSNI